MVKHIVLKNFTKDLKDRKCNLYTACITLGYTPEVWRKSKTIFIPKLGRKDYSDPRWFSPISLVVYIVGSRGASQLGGYLLGTPPGYKANKL